MKEIKCQNCWDFVDCPDKSRNRCGAFRDNMGKECWLVFRAKGGCRKPEKENSCTKCSWYQKINFKSL